MREITDRFTEITNLIENAPLEEFLQFARRYDLSRTATGFYNYVCDKIRERLQREGLSQDILKPE